MVIVVPERVALATFRPRDRPFREVTPPLLPPFRQVAKDRAPLPLVVRQLPEAPSAVGKVSVKLLAVVPDCKVRVLALVPFLKAMAPVLVEAVPRVRLLALVRDKAPKVGVAAVEIPWIVFTTPLLAVKLVALKVAIPLLTPSAAALLMVTVVPEPVALATLRTPDRPFREVTPPLLPPFRQVAKDRAPLPLVVRQLPEAPSAVGKVSVKLLAVVPDCKVRVLALVPFLKAMAPVLVEAVPRVRLLALVRDKAPKVGVAAVEI